MAPTTGTALVILVAFVLPGFVTVLFQERTFKKAEDPTPLDRLLRAVYYSFWAYLILSAVALLFGVDRPMIERTYRRFADDPAQLIWRGALALLLPAVVVATTTRLWRGSTTQRMVQRRLGINERHEVPTAWDALFDRRMATFVRVTFKDGVRVLGYYGPNSAVSYSKEGPDLFLEQTYVPDDQHDWFGEEVASSRGVWMPMSDVISVEFFAPGTDSDTRSLDETEASPPSKVDST